MPQMGYGVYLPMRYWLKSEKFTERAWHKSLSASCCNVESSSYRSQPTKNAWLRISTSSTSNFLPTRWLTSKHSTPSRACSSTTTMVK